MEPRGEISQQEIVDELEKTALSPETERVDFQDHEKSREEIWQSIQSELQQLEATLAQVPDREVGIYERKLCSNAVESLRVGYSLGADVLLFTDKKSRSAGLAAYQLKEVMRLEYAYHTGRDPQSVSIPEIKFFDMMSGGQHIKARNDPEVSRTTEEHFSNLAKALGPYIADKVVLICDEGGGGTGGSSDLDHKLHRLKTTQEQYNYLDPLRLAHYGPKMSGSAGAIIAASELTKLIPSSTVFAYTYEDSGDDALYTATYSVSDQMKSKDYSAAFVRALWNDDAPEYRKQRLAAWLHENGYNSLKEAREDIRLQMLNFAKEKLVNMKTLSSEALGQHYELPEDVELLDSPSKLRYLKKEEPIERPRASVAYLDHRTLESFYYADDYEASKNINSDWASIQSSRPNLAKLISRAEEGVPAIAVYEQNSFKYFLDAVEPSAFRSGLARPAELERFFQLIENGRITVLFSGSRNIGAKEILEALSKRTSQ